MQYSKIQSIVSQIEGTTFAQIKAKTIVKTLKKPHPFGNLHKTAWLNVVLNPIYENSVNRAQKKAGDFSKFIAKPLPWGHFVGNKRLIIENKGKYYLRIQINKVSEVMYYDSMNDTCYTEKEVAPFLRVRKQSKVEVRNFDISNILEIKAFNKTYVGN